MPQRANQMSGPTPLAVTLRAGARGEPSGIVAHL